MKTFPEGYEIKISNHDNTDELPDNCSGIYKSAKIG
jgi:hypothetical protein